MPVFLSGSLIITGSITTSGTITAQTLVVQTITSSIVNLTGSNIFGSRLTDTQTFTGSVVMTGSLTVNTTGTEFQVTNNGVILGNLLTDNHNITGSLRITGSSVAFTGALSGASATFSGSVTIGDGTQTPAGDASITIRKGVAFSGLDFKSARTSGNIGGLRFYDSADILKTQILAEVDSALVVYTNTSSERIRITSGGNVGIAETSPSSRLSIGGVQGSTIGTNVALLVGNTGAAAAVGNMIQMGLHYNPAGATPASVIGAVFTSTTGFTKSDIFFATRDVTTDTAPTERMRITSAGNVGIGTSSPSSILHISSSSSTVTGKVLLQSPSSDSGILQIGSSYGEASMMFIPGVTAFGTSSPTRTSSFGNAALWGLGPGTYTSDHTKFGIANVGYGTNVLTVSASGALGIGTTSPTSRLFVLGAGSYNTPTTEILTSDATIFSSEMSNDAYNSILQLVSVRQSLSTGASSNGFLGFSTIDDSNGEGIRDAGRIAIVNESAASRNSATALSFWTNPGGTKTTSAAEKLRLTSGGYLRLASSGIQFQGATAAANALNYYEQGSWTPALQNATVSYSERSGTYVRIGDYVFVRWGFRISTISGQSGTVTISGLPFTAVSWGSYQEPNISVSTGVLATADNAFKARVYKGGGDTSMYGRIANNADTSWATSDLQNGSWIIGEIFYNVP